MNRAAAEVSRLEVSLADAERKFTAAARPRPAPADNPDDPPYIWASFLTRDEAEAKIAGTSDGTFLIRKRKEKDNQYIMALVFKGKPTHHLIEMINGVWTVNKKPYGSFTILSEVSLVCWTTGIDWKRCGKYGVASICFATRLTTPLALLPITAHYRPGTPHERMARAALPPH